jgi:hypothetical protein
MNNLSQLNLGWVAGVIDGEGYIGLTRRVNRKNSQHNYSQNVNVSNTSMTMLTHLKSVTGIGNIGPEIDHGPGRKLSWVWSLRVQEQALFLPVVLPHLVVKQKHAELLLEYFTTVKPMLGRGHCLPERDIILRMCIFDELADLNRKGRPYP